MSWTNNADLRNRVKNMIRRGYLLSTDASGKLLKGRVKTGKGIENSDIDIIQPVGFASHVAAGPKTEALTMDVGGDPSRRIVIVIGDRDSHPKVGEGEVVLYSPGDPAKAIRVKKDGGISIDGDDQPIDIRTQKVLTMTAELGAVLFNAIEVSPEGDVTFRGGVQINGNLNVSGSIRSPDIKET